MLLLFEGPKGAKGEPGLSISTPVVTSAPISKTVMENETLTMTCQANGNPPPVITWHFHGRATDHRYQQIGQAGLEIRKVNLDDRGNITCRAKNILGESNATAALVVWGMYRILLLSFM